MLKFLVKHIQVRIELLTPPCIFDHIKGEFSFIKLHLDKYFFHMKSLAVVLDKYHNIQFVAKLLNTLNILTILLISFF